MVSSTDGDKTWYVVFCCVMCESALADDMLTYLQLGNPIGGLVYTTAFSADNSTYEQTPYWNVFVACKDCSCPVANANLTLLDSWVETWSE